MSNNKKLLWNTKRTYKLISIYFLLVPNNQYAYVNFGLNRTLVCGEAVVADADAVKGQVAGSSEKPQEN